ncbi:MAG: zinc-binding dehydrogenase [Oscillospiraceae bacterium]|nr:zinc-binding dehydrogenase [Oscillospiraceae bacterium]
MNTKAVRIYGKKDLRLEEFQLPPIGDDEILATVVSDCICMSSYKAAMQGPDHKRVPDNVAVNPTMMGHEFSGEILKVGAKWQSEFSPGQKYAIQPALNYKGSLDAPGYSYRFIGGNATHVVIPNEVMEQKCLLPYNGDAYFYASLAEPMSCVIGAFHASYHTTAGSYVHDMGIAAGGNMAILAGAGPMGLGAIDYAIHCNRKPSLLVVTDIDEARLSRASEVLPIEKAAKNGVKLVYMNTADSAELMALTDGSGFDDVFVYAPVSKVIELGDSILARDGCLNFFAGPTATDFSASLNFYNVHYAATHIVGTSGGNTDDMRESLSMMEQGLIDPAAMITHVGGLDAVIDTTLNLPDIPGGKKLIYTHISMPLTAIEDFGSSDNPVLREIAGIVERNNGLWCAEAERYLFERL